MPQMPPHSITDPNAVTQDEVTRDPRSAPGPGITVADSFPIAPPVPGAPTIDDYDITARLGEGGMGVVWRAMQRSTRREVALKLLSSATVGSDRARIRFEREVELSARLEHPRIARVYDAGVCNGIPYYAMQLVDGVPLDSYVREHQPDRRQLLTLMREVCEAVQHAHQRGIIHRDLKPSNILVDPAGKPTVLDFGLAKATAMDRDLPALSLDGQVAGTPAYMSPEQAAGKTREIDTRSDVYTLGVILYRLLTGSTPHDLTGSTMDVLRRIAEQEARKPRLASKEASRIIDSELETLLMKCLAQDPDLRYPAAGALAQDLDNYLKGEPLLAKRPTATYIIRKRLRKHRIAASVVSIAAMSGIAVFAYAKYRPARYPLDSQPTGASILVNGKPKSGCTMTPCVVPLRRGTHEIRLSKPGYEDIVRRIEVDWGKPMVLATQYDKEPVTLTPTSRYVDFTTTPQGASVTLRHSETGEIASQFVTPSTVRLPRGKYIVEISLNGHPTSTSGQTLEIAGSVVPLSVNIQLQPSE